ncbi:MAG: diacylglycerol kinase [Candidatus Magasanikbacteria bacterium]
MKLQRLAQSFKDAWKGVSYTYQYEQNFRIQVFVSIIVLLAAELFNLAVSEKIVVLMLVLLVIILELINTAVEKFLDLIKPRFDMQVEVVKNIMAAAVFVASFVAVVVGLVVFTPHIVELVV